MRWSLLAGGLSILATAAQSKSWSFNDASLSVSRKGAGVGGGDKEK